MGGNLANTPDEIKRAVARLLAGDAAVASRAVELAVETGELVAAPNGLLQTRGCHLMERAIERSISERLGRPRQAVDPRAIEAVIEAVGKDSGFALQQEQSDAIRLASTTGFSVSDGGAAKRLREATGREAMTVYGFLRPSPMGS